jgi:hypothetical protein
MTMDVCYGERNDEWALWTRPAVHDFEMELRHIAQEVGGVSSKT